MSLAIEAIIERAFENAFSRALVQTVQAKAETLFKKAFENSPSLSKWLEEKIEARFQAFIKNCGRQKKK